jgi:hypothetical protein
MKSMLVCLAAALLTFGTTHASDYQVGQRWVAGPSDRPSYQLVQVGLSEESPDDYTDARSQGSETWLLFDHALGESIATVLENRVPEGDREGYRHLFSFAPPRPGDRYAFYGYGLEFSLEGKEQETLEGRINGESLRFSRDRTASPTVTMAVRREMARLRRTLNHSSRDIESFKRKMHLTWSLGLGFDAYPFHFHGFFHVETESWKGRLTGSGSLLQKIERSFLGGKSWKTESEAWSALLADVRASDIATNYWIDFETHFFYRRHHSREISDRLLNEIRFSYEQDAMDHVAYEVIELRGHGCANALATYRTVTWVLEDGTFYQFIPTYECD